MASYKGLVKLGYCMWAGTYRVGRTRDGHTTCCILFDSRLVVSTSTVNWLERPIPEVNYYVLNSTHSLTVSV